VADTVTRQKRQAGALQFAHDDFVRGITKRRLYGDCVHDFEVLHRVQTASADDTQNLFGHLKIPPGIANKESCVE
jgi:hypothetical protein